MWGGIALRVRPVRAVPIAEIPFLDHALLTAKAQDFLLEIRIAAKEGDSTAFLC